MRSMSYDFTFYGKNRENLCVLKRGMVDAVSACDANFRAWEEEEDGL